LVKDILRALRALDARHHALHASGPAMLAFRVHLGAHGAHEDAGNTVALLASVLIDGHGMSVLAYTDGVSSPPVRRSFARLKRLEIANDGSARSEGSRPASALLAS